MKSFENPSLTMHNVTIVTRLRSPNIPSKTPPKKNSKEKQTSKSITKSSYQKLTNNNTVNQEKTQYITIISKRKVNTNNEVNNEQNLPNITEANNNDIEMTDETNANEVKQETIIDNINQPPKTNVNMKIIPHRNTITTNVITLKNKKEEFDNVLIQAEKEINYLNFPKLFNELELKNKLGIAITGSIANMRKTMNKKMEKIEKKIKKKKKN